MSHPTCTNIRNCLTYTPGGNRNFTTVFVPSTRGLNHARFSTGNMFVLKWTYVFGNQARYLDLSFLSRSIDWIYACYLSCSPISCKFRDKITFGRHIYDLFSSHTRAFPVCVRHAKRSDLIKRSTYLCMMAPYS